MNAIEEPGRPRTEHGRGIAESGADAVFRTLLSWGVDRVFICPGSTEAAFLDASLRYPQIELVLTAHEAVSVAMADGYARATGRPGVVYVHTHLGLANGLAHLYCAFLERSPVVVVAGIKARALHGADGFTTTSDIRSLPRQFVKWDWQTLRLEDLATDLDRALRIAVAGPPGPTFLALPQDLIEAQGSIPLAEPSTLGPTAGIPDPRLLDEAATTLTGAARPVVILGGAATWPDLAPEVEELSALTGAVFLVEDKRSISASSPAGTLSGYAGGSDHIGETLGEADVLLLAGARTPMRFEESQRDPFPLATRLHLVEDSSEVTRGPAGSIPLVGDVRQGLRELVARCRAAADSSPADVTRAAVFRQRVRDEYEHRLRAFESAPGAADSGPVRVPILMRTLVDRAAPGTLLVDDSVTSKGAVLDSVRRPASRVRYITTAGGSLGWGMAAAAGAAQALPDTPVVAVVGDGVFQFGVQSLFTAVCERIPVTYVVINNRGYAAVKAALRRYDGEAIAQGTFPAADLSCQDIAAIARGYGAQAHRVETIAQFEKVFAHEAQRRGPIVIEVITDADDFGP